MGTIHYTEDKTFTMDEIQDLFRSVGWISGEYPHRLYKALNHSSTVLTAWDGRQLVGLIRVIDDSELLAQIHYVLVRPTHQGQGIASRMIELIKEKYEHYMYLEIMPENKDNAAFYQKHGFTLMENGAALQIVKR